MSYTQPNIWSIYEIIHICTRVVYEVKSDHRSQEPITRSHHLPYKPYETTFARIFLFLETVGLLDGRALYAKQYNTMQYDTAQHNLT